MKNDERLNAIAEVLTKTATLEGLNKLSKRVETLEKALEPYIDDMEAGTKWTCPNGHWVVPQDTELEAWECPVCGVKAHPKEWSEEEPSTFQGSYKCQKCGKDWGNGEKMFNSCSWAIYKEDHFCQPSEGGCGKENTVKWVEFEDHVKCSGCGCTWRNWTQRYDFPCGCPMKKIKWVEPKADIKPNKDNILGCGGADHLRINTELNQEGIIFQGNSTENLSDTTIIEPEGEHCQICDYAYLTIYQLPDEIWNDIKPKGKPEGAGLLCISCADRLARNKGYEIYWSGIEKDFPKPKAHKPELSTLENENEKISAPNVDKTVTLSDVDLSHCEAVDLEIPKKIPPEDELRQYIGMVIRSPKGNLFEMKDQTYG